MGKAVNVLPVMLVIFLFLSAGTALAAVQPPPEGGVLPDMEFSVPIRPDLEWCATELEKLDRK